jgi:hypothetical protein
MIRSLSLVVAGLAAAACAPTSGPDTQADGPRRAQTACFNADQVQNFRQGGVGQLHVRALGGGVFQLDVAGGCPNLDFTSRLAILPDGAGLAGGRVCTFDSVRIAVPGATSATDVCRARVTKRLTDEEIAALPDRQRP